MPTLFWDAVTDANLDHYVVYHGTTTGVYFESFAVLAPTTTFDVTFTIANPELNNFYVVTAVNTVPLESGPSNEVVWPNRSTTPRAISRAFRHFA